MDDLFIDTATSLPVRRDHKEGDASTDSTYYVYDIGRLDRASFPDDYFALAKPSPVASDTTTVLPAQPGPDEPGPVEASDDILKRSLDLRALLHLTTDVGVVQQLIDDLTSPIRDEAMDLVGIALSPGELATVKQLFDTQSYGDELSQFDVAHPG